MAGWHEAKQGETFSTIADTYGFQNYKTLYDHAENAELRQVRPNPDVIFPGDRIYIPDFEPKEVPAATDQLHRYVLTFPPKVVRIRLQDFDGKAIPNTAYELQVGPDVFTGATDGDGILEQRVPVQARAATLKIGDFEWTLKIGELNPIDDTEDEGASGIQMRLRNLGFDPGPADGIIGPCTTAAIRAFQQKHPPLDVDGICGPKTKARLLKEHGS